MSSSPTITKRKLKTRRDTNITAQLSTTPITGFPARTKIHHSYPEKISFSPVKETPGTRRRVKSICNEYIDSSNKEDKEKFFYTGKDWVRGCNNIHLTVGDETKTFLEWVDKFKVELQSSEYTLNVESSIDDLSRSMADMSEGEKAIFMLNFVTVMKEHLASKLNLKELTSEQSTFIEKVIANVNQNAFGYHMQTQLCATLERNKIALAEGEDVKKHDVTININLAKNEIVVIETGSFEFKDYGTTSYTGKTRLTPSGNGIEATMLVRRIVETDERLHRCCIEPAVELMSPKQVEKRQWKLRTNPKFISEKNEILFKLDSFLRALKMNGKQEYQAEINSKKKWLKLKLDQMENGLWAVDWEKGEFFSEQRKLIQADIENPKNLQYLETMDKFSSDLYFDIVGREIDYPSYQSIEAQVDAIAKKLVSESISEDDLLTAQQKIVLFKSYISPNKSVELETVYNSLETVREKYFDPKPYFGCEASPSVLSKKHDNAAELSIQVPMPVQQASSSSFMSRFFSNSSTSNLSPQPKKKNVSSTLSVPSVSTSAQQLKSSESNEPTTLFMHRTFM